MRLTVVGASGGIGRELVRQGLDAGHEVTAVVRDSPGGTAAVQEWEQARVPAGTGRTAAGRLRVAVVPALEPAELVDAVAGRDAVLCALGPAGQSADPVNTPGVRAVVEAMRTTGGRRVLAVSAAPLGPPGGGPATYRAALPALRRMFRDHYADLEQMEQLLRDSGLDWTVVRPPKLSDGPATGLQQTALETTAPGGEVSRADVAASMLQLLADPASVGHAYGVA